MKKERNIFSALFLRIYFCCLCLILFTADCSFLNPDSRYISKVSDEGIMGVFDTIVTDSLIFCDYQSYILQLYSCNKETPLTLEREVEGEGDFSSMTYDGRHLAAFAESTIIIYNPLSLARVCEEHVNFEYGSIEIKDTLLYLIPLYDDNGYIYIYTVDFLLQDITLIDSFPEFDTHDLSRGEEIWFLSKYDSLYFCRADSAGFLEKIAGVPTEYSTIGINCDTLFVAVYTDKIVKLYLENRELKSDTIVLDLQSIGMEGEYMKCLYSEGGYFYCIFEINYNGRLFAYSRAEKKFVSWIEDPSVWKCGINDNFIYANNGIYLKPQ
ncbi:MAG: hypothetical protein AB7T10_02475 [bacterium]